MAIVDSEDTVTIYVIYFEVKSAGMNEDQNLEKSTKLALIQTDL